MFDYFFKRTPNAPTSSVGEDAGIVVQATPAKDKEKEKEAALQEARALNGEESNAVEFILRCQFADARLIAAEHLRTKPMLERVLPAMRNADRRVAKLVQARLDAIAFELQREGRAQRCIEQARALLEEQVLLPNRVADLDHAWDLLESPSAAALEEFSTVRGILRGRLEAQAQLQRAVIDLLAALRDLSVRACDIGQDEVVTSLERIEQQMAQHLASTEASSLPKSLLAEFTAQHQQFKQQVSSLDDVRQAIQSRQALLASWENPETLAAMNEESLKRAWRALPPLTDAVAAEQWQQRFQALLHTLPSKTPEPASKPKAASKPVPDSQVTALLAAMQKALDDGSARGAIDIDKQLRAPELQQIRLTAEQHAQLTKMRGELTRLQGWARWGGNISREELLKAAEDLVGKSIAVTELAKQVGGLRDRWKALDVSSGAASKELWERFDATCTSAYAPAAVHFKKLSEERQANLRKAEAIVAEVRQFAISSHCVSHGAESEAVAVDWKAVALFCLHTSQTWQRLGSIDRKDRKRLDAEFEQCMQTLKVPLAAQQHKEAALREQLIAETLALNPADRNALDSIRVLQERWQQQAKALPLERKIEQVLWQKFRAACDALFAKRKELAANADAGRKQHLQEKQNLCAALEAAVKESPAVIAKLLRDTKDAWAKIGQVPRASENQIEARLQKAISALQHQLEASKRAAADAELDALLGKIHLCRTLEQSFVAGQEESSPVGIGQWQALPALSSDFERELRKRFDRVIAAKESGDKQYAATLEKNRDQLMPMLLRLEIVAGVESPAELSRERLRMQVEVLQSTLKTGPVANKQNALLDVCKLAALADDKAVVRIENLVRKLKHSHPAK